jgi:hypothetical protein
MEQPKLTHRFCFTDLADFTTVSVWLGSRLFVVAMSKAQNEDGRYWAKGGWGIKLNTSNRLFKPFPECELPLVARGDGGFDTRRRRVEPDSARR